VPAFFALVAEPLFLLGDAAIVGRLGTEELAGLGVAGVVLQTAVGLCVFLAYGTTAGVARRLGARDLGGALALGVDGLWLAVLLGSVVTVAGVLLAEPLVALLGADPTVSAQAVAYLRPAFLGAVPLLVVLAGTGVLRGLQDTRTPLLVAVGGVVLNVPLNALLVFGPGPVPALGVAGSAYGSVLAQGLAAVALVAVVVRAARREGARLAPSRRGVTGAARAGVPLVVRTLTLRVALLLTAYAVTADTGGGAADVATHQLAMTLWTFLAFVLDAIAIAAQAVTGRYLGAGDVAGTREVTSRMVRWGVGAGVVTGIGLAALSPALGPLFTPDDEVARLLVPVLLVAAIGQPVAGVVFVLDGVLIGAGDGRYLAAAGLVALAAYAPVLLVAAASTSGAVGLVAVWVAFAGVFMGGRLVTLLLRARGDRWLVTGADAGP